MVRLLLSILLFLPAITYAQFNINPVCTNSENVPESAEFTATSNAPWAGNHFSMIFRANENVNISDIQFSGLGVSDFGFGGANGEIVHARVR